MKRAPITALPRIDMRTPAAREAYERKLREAHERVAAQAIYAAFQARRLRATDAPEESMFLRRQAI